MTNLINSVNAVNNVGKVNTTNTEDVKTLFKYVNGELLKDKPDTFTSTAKSVAGSAVVFEGIPIVKFLTRKGLIKKNADKIANGKFVENAMTQLTNTKKDALNKLLHGSDKLTTRINNYVKTANDSVDAYKSIRRVASAQSKEIKAVKKGGDAFIKATQKSETAVKSANEAIGNIGKTLEKKPSKLAEIIAKKFPNLSSKTGKLTKSVAEKFPNLTSKLGKFGKSIKSSGAGFMLAFSGIIEGTTEVIPTFKELGFKKGIKQTGKSAIKVAGDTAGYILGAKAGAAIGTAICPGAGTAVGAICGFVGGLLGSFVMGRITKKITGKSEREKAKEAEEKQQIEQIAKDKEALEELKEIAAQKMAAEQEETGTLSKESQEAYKSLSNLENNELENPFVA